MWVCASVRECAHMHAHEYIDFPFHLFSHLYFSSIPVFFYLFVDIFTKFTLMENAILYHPLTLLLFPFFFFFLFWLIEILLVCLYGMRDENDFVERKKNGNAREGGGGDKKKWQRVEKSMKRWNISEVLEQGQEDMISHDTQLCLTEPEEQTRRRERKETKRGKTGRGGRAEKEKQERGGGARQTNNFSWVKPVSIYQKKNKNTSHWKPMFVHKGQKYCYYKQFADVGTTGPGTKCGN